MLLFLTGDVRIGKTRWLSGLVELLSSKNVTVRGVIAPGVWKKQTENGAIHFEKLGIENILLPQRETIHFATRGDLILKNGGPVASQSESARLMWSIADDAIERVNAHFDSILALGSSREPDPEDAHGLLVVDELGRLEIEHNKGLISATSLIERGPTKAFQHALVVVRNLFLDQALERFSPHWDEVRIIAPDAKGLELVCSLFDETIDSSK